MNANIISLRQVRKVKARADAEKLAEENRMKFGRSKAEKSKSAAEKKLSDKSLDGHKRDP